MKVLLVLLQGLSTTNRLLVTGITIRLLLILPGTIDRLLATGTTNRLIVTGITNSLLVTSTTHRLIIVKALVVPRIEAIATEFKQWCGTAALCRRRRCPNASAFFFETKL